MRKAGECELKLLEQLDALKATAGRNELPLLLMFCRQPFSEQKCGTLKGVVMRWFLGLPPQSIHTFNNLTTTFVSQFATNREKRLEVTDLFDIG
ncbi:hypothetical protein CR513_46993, partial [Mucuna pruriens]